MEIVEIIEAIVGFFAVIGFFVMVSNTTDIKHNTRDCFRAMKRIHDILEVQEEREQNKEAKKIVKPGESIEL